MKSVYKQKEEKYHPQSCHQERTTGDILPRDISDYVCVWVRVCVLMHMSLYVCVYTYIQVQSFKRKLSQSMHTLS